MKTLKALALLLDYPTDSMYDNLSEFKALFLSDENLSDAEKASLVSFIENFEKQSLLDWQSYYDGLFERGRALSLLLFEHVHGESRDRGQAMIDLIAQYKNAGLEIGVKELPDYIPLFLEFLSTQGLDNARGWLQDVSHILALLAARLQKRDSHYSAIFTALLELSQAEIDLEDVKRQIADEKRDDTRKAIDKVWEEEMVTFGPGDTCGTDTLRPSPSQNRQQEVPIEFVDAVVKNTNLQQQAQ